MKTMLLKEFQEKAIAKFGNNPIVKLPKTGE